jgi:hypothetical protein
VVDCICGQVGIGRRPLPVVVQQAGEEVLGAIADGLLGLTDVFAARPANRAGVDRVRSHGS